MSGFLPDLASWALGGGAGNNNNSNDGDNDNNGGGGGGRDSRMAADSSSDAPLTEQEVRARRLARMEASGSATVAAPHESSASGPQAMDIDESSSSPNSTEAVVAFDTATTTAPMPIDMSPPRKAPPVTLNEQTSQQSKKRAKESHLSKAAAASGSIDPSKKTQRKKEFVLKKVLQITLTNGINSTSHANQDPACLAMELDDPIPLEPASIAEILATRLSLPVEDIRTLPPQKPFLLYLGQAYRKAGDELKMIQPSSAGASTLYSSNSKKQAEIEELVALLEEIQRQVVNYAASSLMEPDLFDQAKDGVEQLTKALLNSGVDPISDITFGVSGPSSSFYQMLCDELYTQDPVAFERVLRTVVTTLLQSLKTCDTLDSGVGDTSALGIVSALTSLCSHKKAALTVTQMDQIFLLPPPGTPAAMESIRPPVPPGADLLRMFAADNRPYLRRSGPGLEKETLLGLALRISTPKSNPAFSATNILRQSLDSVERATSQQRQQLRVYQDACHMLIMNLIKGGPDARAKVLQWFVDCQVVNFGATAMRPDPTKVSNSSMLLNTSVALLKLCDPFVGDAKKHHLIDPAFVSHSELGKLIFPTSGDNAIHRLGGEREDNGNGDTAMGTTTSEYNPKNSFIPQVFFLTARSLGLGIVPLLSSHENLLRHINHQHWELNSQNRDIYSDPHFCMLVSRQRSSEVALFQDEMIADTLRMVNLMAKVLVGLSDTFLAQMPEPFVDNICDILMSVAKLKPRMLRGIDLRFVFSLMVKLLSSTYTSMIRNYNLRAMLGDVLSELFLPSTSDNRKDVPASVACDPLAGGQTYLLSDPLAQKTLAPSLLLLYGEVEHTGYYDKMSHRAKISSLLKYLWESSEHRPAFREITQDKENFIKFANGIINETNTLIATVMQKLPEIRAAQEQMANADDWGRLSEEEQGNVSSRLEDNEREVKHALPLCNKTLQMFGYLNTDSDIRSLFLLESLCPRLVNMLLHVLGKLVGSKGLDLKVNNPEQYEFRPKEMLRDLCAIFALFASSGEFQVECAKSGCNPDMLRSAIRTCQRLTLLTGESMTAFESLPNLVEEASRAVAEDEALLTDAPDEFLDEIMSTFMKDPVVLPSGHFVDRSTITQHLLNDPIDPFNREAMTIDDVKPATELKAKIDLWLDEKRAARLAASGTSQATNL